MYQVLPPHLSALAISGCKDSEGELRLLGSFYAGCTWGPHLGYRRGRLGRLGWHHLARVLVPVFLLIAVPVIAPSGVEIASLRPCRQNLQVVTCIPWIWLVT